MQPFSPIGAYTIISKTGSLWKAYHGHGFKWNLWNKLGFLLLESSCTLWCVYIFDSKITTYGKYIFHIKETGPIVVVEIFIIAFDRSRITLSSAHDQFFWAKLIIDRFCMSLCCYCTFTAVTLKTRLQQHLFLNYKIQLIICYCLWKFVSFNATTDITGVSF